MRQAEQRLHVLKELVRDVAQKGFFHLFSANIVITLLGFGSQLLVTTFLTPAEMGHIRTMASFISVATILAGMGFNTAVLKLCSELRSDEERFYIFRKSIWYSAVPTAVVLIGILTVARLHLFSPVQIVNDWIFVYALVIPSTVLGSLAMVYLQALKRIKLMASTQTLIRAIGTFVLVISAYFFKLQGYVFSVVLVNALTVFPLLWLVRRASLSTRVVPVSPSAGRDKAVHRKILYYARWSFAANLVNTVMVNIDILMMNYLIADRTAFGYYSIATIFQMGLTQITTTAQSIVTPYFSEKSNDREEFARVLKKYQRIMVLGSLSVSVVAIVIVPPFVGIVYGKGYAAVGAIFNILCIRYFFMSCYAILGAAILGLGEMKYNFFVVLVTSFVSLPLNFFFIKWYGLFGAACAQGLSALIVLCMMLIMARFVVKTHFGSGRHRDEVIRQAEFTVLS